MEQKIRNVKDIKWFSQNPPLSNEDSLLIKTIPFKLPDEFIELLKISNGGYIDYDFSYHDMYHDRVFGGGIGEIYGISHGILEGGDIIKHFQDPPEFFPNNLLGFAQDGGGAVVCFDYRADVNLSDPPIVYWIGSHGEGKDISFLANNFVQFLELLEEHSDDI